MPASPRPVVFREPLAVPADRAPQVHKITKTKLSEQDVREVKRLLAEGGSERKVAAAFGVGRSTVSDIAKGVTWRHIE